MITEAFRQGFMDKLAAIRSPEDLNDFYKKVRYRILNKDTNHPYFNTNFETFDHWHLLSPEQIKKHKIGICWDTVAMTDKVLSDLGVEHANYFAHSKDLSKATHGFNVYKDKDGNWRWIEGSWKPYKGNDWKERRKKDIVKRIVNALEEASGDKQIIHSVDKFPEPGIGDKEFYEEMLKNPVKKAEFIKAAAKDYGGMDYGHGYVPTYEEKQDLKEVDGKLVPKTVEEKDRDARQWAADVVRGGALPLTLVPGVGLVGAAGIIGAGETAASGIEGRSLGESVDRGTTAGVLTYGGGKALSVLGKHVIAPAYRWAARGVKNHIVNPAINRVARFYTKHFPMTDSALAKSIRAPVEGDSSPTFLRRRLYQIASDLEPVSMGATPAERLELQKRLGKEGYDALRAARGPLTEHEKLESVRRGEALLRENYGDLIPELSTREGFFKELPPPLRRFSSLDDLARSLGIEEGSTSYIFKGGPALAEFDPNKVGFFSGNFRVAGGHTPTRQYLMAADLGSGPFAESVVSRETPHLSWMQQSFNDPAFSAMAREEFAKKLSEIDAGTRSIPHEWAGLPDWRTHYAPNYEVVLKGDEVSGLPWRYFQKMPGGSFVERSVPVNAPSRLGDYAGTIDRDRLGENTAFKLVSQVEGK